MTVIISPQWCDVVLLTCF